jgi:cardiolipin synthase
VPPENFGAILAVSYLLVELVAVLLAIDAVMKGRTPQGTIAWVAGLIAFAPITIPLYVVFGSRRFAGYVKARRRGVSALNRLANRYAEQLKPYRVALGRRASEPGEDAVYLPVVRGNTVKLLVDGEETFGAIFAAIQGATRSVAVQFYIVRDDGLGRQLKHAMIDAARRGVNVYFLYDGLGSASLGRPYLRDLRQAGVQAQEFRPSRAPRLRVQLNFRNHRKVVIVDGQTAFVGGHNVGDEYLGKNPTFGPWRDTHMCIDGPAARSVQLSFVEDWYCCTRRLPDLCWPDPVSTPDDARVGILATGPADEVEGCLLAFVHLIHAARTRLWIATPYFVPDPAIIAAIQAASLRGVDVALLIPAKGDNRLVDLAARSFLDELLPLRIRVYEHVNGFMHQKVMLSDDTAVVGTANLDNRSMRINFEISAVTDDAAFARAVEAMLAEDFAKARAISPDRFAQRPFHVRLASRLAHLASPVL